MRCPRDQDTLAPRAVPGGSVWACPTCDGLFVEAAHRDAVLAATPPAPPAPPPVWERPTYLACPSCGKGTRRINYLRVSGVLVDDCPWCGTWFDAGELARVAAFLADGGAARSAEMEARLSDERAATAEKLARLEARTREVEAAARRRHRW